MPFNHNDHYHPLLLDQLPPGPGIALDVGCGTGRFARRLAATGMAVEALDVSAAMVEAASGLGSPGPGKIVYRQADITTDDLPEQHYDYISCLASLHHVPFATVTKLRRALVPGGVLVVLTPAWPSGPRDWLRELAAVAGERAGPAGRPHAASGSTAAGTTGRRRPLCSGSRRWPRCGATPPGCCPGARSGRCCSGAR